MFSESNVSVIVSAATKVAIVAAGVIVANVGTAGAKAGYAKVKGWFRKS